MTTPDTVPAAILARLAHLDGMTQTTLVPADADAGHAGGTVTAYLHLGKSIRSSPIEIELVWRGVEDVDMPGAVYNALADHANTDQIEASIRTAFLRAGGADVEVTLDWRETSATVTVTLEAHMRFGPRDNGGLRLVASTAHDDVGHYDGDVSADVALEAYVHAVGKSNGQLITGYTVGTRSDYDSTAAYYAAVDDVARANDLALKAARKLLLSLGLWSPLWMPC